jgi:hypothetical protein
MLRLGLIAALVILSAPSAHAARVFVDAGALTASIAEGLLAELERTDLADRAADADAEVRVRPAADGALDLLVTAGAEATPLIDRRIPLEPDAAPAVRLVVLLAAEALAPKVALDRSARPNLELELGFDAALWARPTGVEPGVVLAARLAVGRKLSVGGRLRFGGLVCCALAVPGVMSGTPNVVAALLEGELGLGSAAGFSFLVQGGVGVDRRGVDSQVQVYAGPAPPLSVDGIEGLARLGLVLVAPEVLGLRLRLAAGVEARVPRVGVSLAPFYTAGDPVLDPGPVVPWAEAGLEVAFF